MLAQFDVKQDFSFLTKGLKLHALFNVSRYAFSSVTRSYNPYWYEVGLYDKLTNEYTLNLLNEDSGTEYLDFNHSFPDVKSTTYIQATLNYNRTFSEKHGIRGLLVFLMQNEVMNQPQSRSAESRVGKKCAS